jgi:regulator of sirC expression with transglutaminase-like and TPR domain
VINKTEKEIKALISLLSETAPKNLIVIKNKLIDLKQKAFPFLQEALTHENPKIRNAVSSILEEIRIDDLTRKWIAFASGKGDVDLEEGAFLYSTYGYPHLDVAQYQRILNQWTDEIARLLNSGRLIEKSFQIVLNYFFQTLGFTGNRENYHDPENSYLPAVIDSKKGLPITLSVIFLLITKRLNLPFFPVGMPGHFIVKYQGDGEMFFIDPFNGGKVLTEQDCINFLTNSGYGYREEYLQITGNRAILERMIRNLINVYTQNDDQPAVTFMTKLIEILHRP